MSILAIAQLLTLLTLANTAPLVAARVLGRRLAFPVDANLHFFDGRPIFGPSKTIRGVIIAVVFTGAGALLIGLELGTGLIAGTVAMVGDLLASFTKRRLGLPSSSRATGFDQIPESLLPALACRSVMALSWLDIAVSLVLFFVGEIILSRLLFRLHLRDRPY